ncbi:MAG: hypothetical protein ACOCRL_00075 [Bacillota bacterium]
MTQLSTFEEIFNKLSKEFKGKQVNIVTKQDGIKITSLKTTVDDINIKPLNKRQSKKWNKLGHKIGLIIISEKYNNNEINIPFILGFNTMKATFLKNGATIKSLDMEFLIKRVEKSRRKLA